MFQNFNNLVSINEYFGNKQKKTINSRNTLPATSRQKNQTLTLDRKLHLDLTKLARPVYENQIFCRLEKVVLAIL